MEARSSVFQAAHEHLSRPLWTPPGEHGGPKVTLEWAAPPLGPRAWGL